MLHSDIPTTSQIEELIEHRHRASVSLYLPTGRAGLDAHTSRTTLTNLSRAVDERLASNDADRSDREAIADVLGAMVDDDAFWERQCDTLAIFLDPESERTFRLPSTLSESVHVADRFHVKPLLRAVTFPNAAYVLALSKGEARLLEIFSEGPPERVDVADLPRDAWVPPANHVHMARDRAYVRQVDHALRGVLNGSHLPLIVAATEGIDALYRTVNTYPNLVERRLAGNAEELTDGELATAVREILDEVYRARLDDLALTFDRRSSQGRAAFDISDISRFATIGAVDTVLVDVDAHVPGTIDDSTGAVTFERNGDADTYGVVDEIARRVIANGGRVLAVRSDDIPHGGHAAALLRYTP